MGIALNEELKQREISTLAKEHKERHAGLERLVVSAAAGILLVNMR
jgi:hypothetical protein